MTPRKATASEEALLRIFTVPEAPDSTLSVIEQNISQNLMGFLQESVVAVEKPLSEVELDFQQYHIPSAPQFVSDYADNMMQTLVAHSVHTSAPSFIGHMTSALPYFVLPLSKMMVGLNQNLVKIETSKAFTPLERQVLGMMHHLVYNQDQAFYQSWMHSADVSLGAFCSGGTVANITALWTARNQLLKADGDFKGIAKQGLVKGLRHYGYDDLAILVSERGHYSLAKTADLLGVGRENIIQVPTSNDNKVDVAKMRQLAAKLAADNIKVMAIVGVAGTTETGNIDPLNELADLAAELNCHFHVDAAWGGASLLSNKYRHLLAGIERADSVTIDAHKQMYVPMGAGMVIFKDPTFANAIKHHAEYILRQGSKDLGSQTLEGSRPGMAMLVHACLQVIGREGYEILINNSLEKARYFAELISAEANFELVSEPELCLLTYRYVPQSVQLAMANARETGDTETLKQFNTLLDGLTKFVQKTQREQGTSFVSRTRINPENHQLMDIKAVVFRVVLANPLTTHEILQQVLAEQTQIANSDTRFLPKLLQLAQS
ncbi:pyridoxal-dependent aspartate 1-decarboxylase PanP [Shewanella fidelis]|uniref:Pyridoxal-dependent aspartate 1-decarboxylase n=1 Tax=Shewanella fidelis TaxID=173509 RepID=A0AAW8NKY6_9GAMM|nr:putative pyridoxal-dependent aspartate 1-decarboxylase [Shewanella fidelis]MDR8523206.1 putative pyridoxal-dependent aspartate 1-decarboxylase [Shewanella fidelis]MDW4811468.1 putative pyridoxal-dependent aspartate 1-decarboxylase [Shewanella fidelis]MDW4815589.1 putative pyridoxal-dependent aspartate 1-decarboxylase [Shewanella fidelis]MDW4819679.1 putative pyridoxal-dependent aspartate 1-decarboxylase [Shewanella fidelis]MDW4824347.1 putative pyridoxal-dependent aspartate 1-decarboxylase 